MEDVLLATGDYECVVRIISLFVCRKPNPAERFKPQQAFEVIRHD